MDLVHRRSQNSYDSTPSLSLSRSFIVLLLPNFFQPFQHVLLSELNGILVLALRINILKKKVCSSPVGTSIQECIERRPSKSILDWLLWRRRWVALTWRVESSMLWSGRGDGTQCVVLPCCIPLTRFLLYANVSTIFLGWALSCTASREASKIKTCGSRETLWLGPFSHREQKAARYGMYVAHTTRSRVHVA